MLTLACWLLRFLSHRYLTSHIFKYGVPILRAFNANELFFSRASNQGWITVRWARGARREKYWRGRRYEAGDERIGRRELRLRLGAFVLPLWLDFAELCSHIRTQARIILRPDRDQLHGIF